MQGVIDTPRTDMSPYAPRMTRIKIPINKIGAVIGPGGKMIRSIVEETKATVDVQDDGTVMIGSTDADSSRKAIEIIEGLTKEAKVGDIYTGKVVRILNFGAFVEILPGTDGMVHISELADYRVPKVEDVLQLGDMVKVEVIGIDPSGKIGLSRKSLLNKGDTSNEDSSNSEHGDRDGRETVEQSSPDKPKSGWRRDNSGSR